MFSGAAKLLKRVSDVMVDPIICSSQFGEFKEHCWHQRESRLVPLGNCQLGNVSRHKYCCRCGDDVWVEDHPYPDGY